MPTTRYDTQSLLVPCGETRCFRDLSTVDACSSHGIGNHSSACRYAVSLGLMIYYPYGRTDRFRPEGHSISLLVSR